MNSEQIEVVEHEIEIVAKTIKIDNYEYCYLVPEVNGSDFEPVTLSMLIKYIRGATFATNLVSNVDSVINKFLGIIPPELDQFFIIHGYEENTEEGVIIHIISGKDYCARRLHTTVPIGCIGKQGFLFLSKWRP